MRWATPYCRTLLLQFFNYKKIFFLPKKKKKNQLFPISKDGVVKMANSPSTKNYPESYDEPYLMAHWSEKLARACFSVSWRITLGIATLLSSTAWCNTWNKQNIAQWTLSENYLCVKKYVKKTDGQDSCTFAINTNCHWTYIQENQVRCWFSRQVDSPHLENLCQSSYLLFSAPILALCQTKLSLNDLITQKWLKKYSAKLFHLYNLWGKTKIY